MAQDGDYYPIHTKQVHVFNGQYIQSFLMDLWPSPASDKLKDFLQSHKYQEVIQHWPFDPLFEVPQPVEKVTWTNPVHKDDMKGSFYRCWPPAEPVRTNPLYQPHDQRIVIYLVAELEDVVHGKSLPNHELTWPSAWTVKSGIVRPTKCSINGSMSLLSNMKKQTGLWVLLILEIYAVAISLPRHSLIASDTWRHGKFPI